MHAEPCLLTDGDGSARGGALEVACPVAIRVFPGVPGQSPAVRAWVRLLMAGRPVDAEDAEAVVAELFGNAVLHTRSGDGGLVTVAVTSSSVVHVHDQGAAAGGAPRRGGRDVVESGRGLLIVAGLAADHGFGPAARCTVAGPPVAGRRGRCSWACLRAVPVRRLYGDAQRQAAALAGER